MKSLKINLDKNKRYNDLLKKREKALQELSRARQALGSGSWHEDSVYELADSDARVYEALLIDIEEELRELSKDG